MRTSHPVTLFAAALIALVLSAASGTADMMARCGNANGRSHLQMPPTSLQDLCLVGTPSRVRGDGPWTWQCKNGNLVQDACFAAPGAVKLVTMLSSRTDLKHLTQQLQRAQKLFKQKRNLTFALKLPAGPIDLSRNARGKTIYCEPTPGNCGGLPVFDVSGVDPGPKGRLLILGSGSDRTKIIASPDQNQFFGRNAQRVTIEGMEFSRDRLDASQGTAVAKSVPTPDGTHKWVGIDISAGFPQMETFPVGLWTGKSGPGSGHFLRRYETNPACTIDTSFSQVLYTGVLQDQNVPNRWWFHLSQNNPFSTDGGDLVGIKAKNGAGQAYVFLGSDDIMFDDVRWLRRSRGVFRTGTIHVQIYDSQIVPNIPIEGQAVCMAGSGGGPQIGQPHDAPTWGNVIDNFQAINTGDDSIAVFNGYDPSGNVGIHIRHTIVRGSFARSIGLFNTAFDVPHGIDLWTIDHFDNCNSALPFIYAHEPSVADTDSDVGFSECVLSE